MRAGNLLALGVIAFIAAATWSSAPLAAPQAGAEPSRDEMDSVGEVRGPISDFWLKVRSEWSGYLQTSSGALADGSGPLRERSLVNPPPNRVWVSLVYGDMFSDGKPQPLAYLFDEFITEYKQAEGRNWPYAQIFDRPWEKMSPQGRAQDIIMIGTPWSLPPVGPLAESLGFSIAPGRIDIGKRKYRGDNLILIFIAPNPFNPEKYALVITGTNDEALMQAGHLPYGDTDYVLFRGRRTLESGQLAKPAKPRPAPGSAPAKPASPAAAVASTHWGPPESWQSSGTHHGFSIRESANYTFFYEPDRLTREELDALANAREAAYPSLKSLTPTGHDPGRITYYLYPTVDRKIDETARDEVVHVDLATGEIHTVYSRLERVMEPYLDIMVMLHRSIGPTRVPQLERALAIALAPDFQGRDIDPMAARLFQDMKGRESAVIEALRDQDVITPADGPPSSHDLLLAAFMKDLVRRHGREQAFEFVARASPGRLDGVFQQVYRLDLSRALATWASTMKPESAPSARLSSGRLAAGATTPVAQDPLIANGLGLMLRRQDVEATRVLEEALGKVPGSPTVLCALARLKFRHGEFDAAEKRAQEALASCAKDAASNPECAEAEAWSHLTLGRAEAVRGRYITARIELTHPAVTGGPLPVPTLADYWLFTMGQSRNQLTVISHIKREARVSLRNLDWREAEAGLKRALEIDPTDGEAHKLLSEVYHKEHEYWAWQIRYLNEIHPDYNVLSGIFVPKSEAPFAARVEQLHSIDSFNDLVLRGNVELLKAQSLYAVEIQNLHAEGDRFLLERRDIPEALRMYKRALELNPDFFLSHFLVGRCYFLMDHYEEARRSFEEVLRRKPTDKLVAAWTHTYLGYIALQSDDLAGARRDFERALAQADQGKVGALAREGLGRVDTIRLVAPRGLGH